MILDCMHTVHRKYLLLESPILTILAVTSSFVLVVALNIPASGLARIRTVKNLHQKVYQDE